MTDDDIVADVIDHHSAEPTEKLGATGVLVLQVTACGSERRRSFHGQGGTGAVSGLGPCRRGFLPTLPPWLFGAFGEITVRQREAIQCPSSAYS